jgi:hypothetical protein
MSVRLSVCLSSCMYQRAPLYWFPWNLILGTFMEICRKKSKVDYSRTKIHGNLHGDRGTFYCCRRHKLAIKVLLYKTLFLYCWQWRVAECTEKALLCFHCNYAYAYVPQCCVLTCIACLVLVHTVSVQPLVFVSLQDSSFLPVFCKCMRQIPAVT